MSTITLRSWFDVSLMSMAGSDQFICMAARVSTQGSDSVDSEESQGLINFLMKNRHGSPFEHGLMTFRITAPIFVWREFMRHRIGFSYNEESGRYKVLDGTFYVPNRYRPLQQVGKAGAYTFEKGTNEQAHLVQMAALDAYEMAWRQYETMLDAGVAKEVARIVLPVATYSTAYVTCNPRSLMSFLSLRTHDDRSTFASFPQWEIEQVALQMERYFQEKFPLTAMAFNNNGRVSP